MSSFPSFYQSIHEDEEEDAHSDRMRMAMMASLVATSSNTREYIDRGREAGQRLLMDDYWNPNPTYNARIFRRRFRMQRHLFNRIMTDVMAFDPYFLSTADAANKEGNSKLIYSRKVSPNGFIPSSIYIQATKRRDVC
ncbi:unnamed protein product [Cuscuta epithymum]|uniref:Uncharacterized protein n=1 Tax=Cuscuta epithymum TaxID=186058 RepID=A0AAV0EQ25_9ASTE|nr:unnamed protein product [Cuscuta epithymum]CAH9125343.1 unnamed protein product [Cuscuta epithymum]